MHLCMTFGTLTCTMYYYYYYYYYYHHYYHFLLPIFS